MIQLVASIILMYAVVGSAGMWAVRRQRQMADTEQTRIRTR